MGHANVFWRNIAHALCCCFTVTTPCLTLPCSPSSFWRNPKWLHLPPTVLPWFGTLWLLPISWKEIGTERTPVWYHWGVPGRIVESVWHCDGKGLPGSIPKMEETVGLVATCGRELLQGWWGPIGLMVSSMIFTVSVWNNLDTTMCNLLVHQSLHLLCASLWHVNKF
jgi:hypothetical protein